jgi:cytochrome c-type biogenesis protein CcmH/NrfG
MNLLNGFWFAAGLLCGVGAAAFILPALRRSPGGAERGFPLWGLLAAAGGLGVVVGLYLWLGRPDLVGTPATAPATAAATVPHAMGAPAVGQPGAAGSAAASMDAAVAGLEQRLAKGEGSDADWNLLAQSYDFLGRSADAVLARSKHLPAVRTAVPVAAKPAPVRTLDAAALKLVEAANVARRARNYAAARDAYVKLAARGTMTADTWADYADVSASLNGGNLAGDPEKYIASALALDPQHPKALWLQGSMLHEARRYQEAVVAWQRLAAVLDPNSSDAKLIAANIEEDRRLAGTATPMARPAAAAPGAVAVTGEILVSEALKPRAASGLTLFVVAKVPDQPGPPVAVLRTTTGQWPLRFKLDDSLSMMPTRLLSGASKVTIEARISRSGQALPAAGDLQGSSGEIDPKAGRPVRILIDRVVN